ncbi:DUF4349 domain-containing protein [Chryseobacterium sp. SNU WT5]|uniref:DUF4349 domain-containing protein n=1 Tax=Chryseobacterium sp. SNU WT5 TaxID=2594269 RepID=UPI00118019A6|nr:DUF4349 domain-containing protein [Chryseobacterium sp. SNU WT5]QDP85086.1 DUF4349 domain-containing protein [Chryseobacterium sp. SNU WT5]
MKTQNFSILLGSLMLGTIFSCNKTEGSATYDQVNAIDQTTTAEISDSISTVASLQVKDKQFIKSAEVNMEVKDVYDATVFIEKSLKNLGGFVTKSQLHSQTISEETFAISDENAMLVRKFQTENDMEVRVPTEKLGDFLQLINDKKVFLNSRVILAEDVTANIKFAKLEEVRVAKTGSNITKLNHDKAKVILTDDNDSEGNHQKITSFEMQDQLKYSNVHISLKEPQLRITQIAVTNAQNLDNQYKNNFLYDAKNNVIEGFYLIQKIMLGLLKVWPLIVIGIIATIFYRRSKSKGIVKFTEKND